MSNKLHELLAVQGKLETQAKKLADDLAKTFHSKRHLFEKKTIVFKPFAEDEPDKVESQSDLNTTVVDELKLLSPFIVKSMDANLRVSEANTRAKADIVMEDGTILAKGVPATTLLELEKTVGELTNLLKAIPTLDPAKGFNLDPDAGPNIFQARPVEKNRTTKEQHPVVLYEATKEHPAQVQLVTKDVPVGVIFEQEWSGLVTPARKSEYIEKAESLVRAIRKARARANEVEVDKSQKVGDKILKTIFG